MSNIKKIIFLLFLSSSIGLAIIWEVPENFPDGIQSAISSYQVINGDTVSVLQGTWYERINFLGKNILVVNRDFLGGSNNPATCIIDGGHHNSVVKIVSGENQNAILKGFTIQNGDSVDKGGGIRIDSASPTIIYNLIRKNHADYGGGISSGRSSGLIKCPMIISNVITGNRAEFKGGGIDVDHDTIKITDNLIINDTCYSGHGGGGIHIDNCRNGTAILGNIIDTNYSGGIYAGGGILFEGGTNAKVRYNTIKRNSSNDTIGWGIYCIDSLPDIGTNNDPGFNIFYGNDAKDMYNAEPNLTLNACGNFWGTLDVDTIKAHLGLNIGGHSVNYNLISASDKIAKIQYNSRCSTDVIVTGDLTIDSSVTLTINPQSNFSFFTSPDTNTGYSPNLCELIVDGTLQAEGNEDNKINFIPFSTQPEPGNWYGILLRDNGTAVFNNCTIGYAYIGIKAVGNDVSLSVDSTIVESNAMYGIRIQSTQNAEIKESEFSSNVIGIYCDNEAYVDILNNQFLLNSRYGISCVDISNTNIVENYIYDNSDSPTLNGINLSNIGEGVIVYKNSIVGWKQCGISNVQSDAQINNNTITDNLFDGILCSNSSSPKVRWCQIENNETGVYCDNTFPDLGTDVDSGYNSIYSDNYYYVVNTSETNQTIPAIYNWWGIEEPNPDKFIGLIKYNPWLTNPPEGGGQSAGIRTTKSLFTLYAPKPNPATNAVKIAYSLPNRCKTEFIIYNSTGQIVTKSVEDKDAGRYEYLGNSKDFPNGVYIIRLKANDKLGTQKVVISK